MSTAIPVREIAGFDFLSAAQYQGGATPLYSSMEAVDTGPYGGQAARMQTSGAVGTRTLARQSDYTAIPNGSGFTIGGHIRLNPSGGTNSPTAHRYFILSTAGGATQVASIANGNNIRSLSIRNAANTLVAEGSTILVSGLWYHVELVGTIGTSVTLSLYLNGVLECTASGVNCGTTAAARWASQVSATTGGSNYSLNIDNVFIAATATQLGERLVNKIMPAVEGADTAWTANTGTKVSRVNDATSYDSDTGYIYSSIPGDRETFTVDALLTGATPDAVKVTATSRKDDATTRQVTSVVRTGGTDYDHTTLTAGLTTSYGSFEWMYDQRPDATDWASSDFGASAAEFGVKLAT